jgi:hypothetical protein
MFRLYKPPARRLPKLQALNPFPTFLFNMDDCMLQDASTLSRGDLSYASRIQSEYKVYVTHVQKSRPNFGCATPKLQIRQRGLPFWLVL